MSSWDFFDAIHLTGPSPAVFSKWLCKFILGPFLPLCSKLALAMSSGLSAVNLDVSHKAEMWSPDSSGSFVSFLLHWLSTCSGLTFLTNRTRVSVGWRVFCSRLFGSTEFCLFTWLWTVFAFLWWLCKIVLDAILITLFRSKVPNGQYLNMRMLERLFGLHCFLDLVELLCDFMLDALCLIMFKIELSLSSAWVSVLSSVCF